MRPIALAIILSLLAMPAAAETAAQRAQKAAVAQKELKQTRARIKALAEEQRRLQDQRDQAGKALREADGEVSVSQRALQRTEASLASQEAALAELQARQAKLEADLAGQRKALAALVRSAYAAGEHGELKMLLEQDRIADLARVLAYHRYFDRDRRARITGINAQLLELAELGDRVQAARTGLLATRAQQQEALAKLARQRRDRGKLVSSLDSKYRDSGARIKALGRDEKSTVELLEKLRKLMAQLPKPKPARTTRPPRTGAGAAPARPPNAAIPLGPLNLPLAGSVLAGFGGTMPDGHESRGLLIAGKAGDEVHAVSAGRVAYADWLKGYGLLMIIDHGNGWMTLYAFNDALLKNTGDNVRADEAISTVGSSGGQGRTALYFELRRNGQAQDPRSWLRR